MLTNEFKGNENSLTISRGKDSAKDGVRMDTVTSSLFELERLISLELKGADDKDMVKKFCDEYRGCAILSMMLMQGTLGADPADFDILARYCDIAKDRIASVNSLFEEFTGIEDAVGQITDKTLEGATDQMSLYSLLATKMAAIDAAFSEMAIALGVATLPLK